MHNIARRLKLFWHSYKPIFDISSNISDTILVAGSARSGTTWIGSVCAKMLNARPIFEPFILDKEKKFFLLFNRVWNGTNKDQLLMNYCLYISPKMDVDVYLLYQIESILKGKIRSFWTDKETSIKIYSKRVIKEIRANLLLNFLAHRWPKMKIIWIIRNPLEVIKSQLYLSLKYGWKFDFDEKILEQKQLVKEWLLPFIKEIKKAKTLPERLMHRWCIENFVPFNQKVYSLSNVLLVTYNKLVSSKDEWKKINFFLNKHKWNDDLLDKYLAKPSRTYIKRSDKDMNFILKHTSFCEKKLMNIAKTYGLEKFLI